MSGQWQIIAGLAAKRHPLPDDFDVSSAELAPESRQIAGKLLEIGRIVFCPRRRFCVADMKGRTHVVQAVYGRCQVAFVTLRLLPGSTGAGGAAFGDLAADRAQRQLGQARQRRCTSGDAQYDCV